MRVDISRGGGGGDAALRVSKIFFASNSLFFKDGRKKN